MPLLVSGRKFHIRAYVLCVGSLSVYAFSEALALFAGKPYRKLAPPHIRQQGHQLVQILYLLQSALVCTQVSENTNHA